MRIAGIIPARFASTRFPGKPLVDIDGKSMIQRVYEQAKKTTELYDVIVATDDERIFAHVKLFGGDVVMTSSSHASGTDRCYEALQKTGLPFDAVINIQGDEPFIEPEQISLLAKEIVKPSSQISTLTRRIHSTEMLKDPNKVKVVLDHHDYALYFSRQAIPYQNRPQEEWLQNHPYYLHVGLYAYRTEILDAITQLNQGILEKAESLEQLRWLENGFKIKVTETQHESYGVDTPEDLKTLLKSFGK
jgi:3-deoxy-manno-octulosonate cytidylyltransferase (CMP-KDO synthetase)